MKLELVCIILFFSDIASTMPSADLGRIDLGDVTPHNIKLLRKVNTVVFPVSYHDKFYKVDLYLFPLDNTIGEFFRMC